MRRALTTELPSQFVEESSTPTVMNGGELPYSTNKPLESAQL